MKQPEYRRFRRHSHASCPLFALFDSMQCGGPCPQSVDLPIPTDVGGVDRGSRCYSYIILGDRMMGISRGTGLPGCISIDWGNLMRTKPARQAVTRRWLRDGENMLCPLFDSLPLPPNCRLLFSADRRVRARARDGFNGFVFSRSRSFPCRKPFSRIRIMVSPFHSVGSLCTFVA